MFELAKIFRFLPAEVPPTRVALIDQLLVKPLKKNATFELADIFHVVLPPEVITPHTGSPSRATFK